MTTPQTSEKSNKMAPHPQKSRQDRLKDLLGDRIISEQPKFDKHGQQKCIKFTCKCPMKGCPNTTKVEKHKHINNLCRSCATIGRVKVRNNEYRVSTTNIDMVHFDDVKRFRQLFIREEVCEYNKHFRYVLKCPNPECEREIKIRHHHEPKPCNSCCRKLRPYERKYNCAIKRRTFQKSNGVTVTWLLSYEQYEMLCNIDRCHYCNSSLNRAKFKAEEGTTGILLDRIDSNGNYEIGNVVPCCAHCNFTKNEHISYDEMVLIMKHRGLWTDKDLPT